jgi:hypothetical protein
MTSSWSTIYGGGAAGGGWPNEHASSGGLNGPKPAGGGSVLSGIEQFIEKTPGSNVLSNLAGGAMHAGEGVAQGLWALGRMGAQDVINHPASLLAGPLAPVAADVISHAEGGHGTHLENQFAVPLAKYYSHKYAPIFEHPLTGKSYKGVEDDPFGTFLDVATLATIPFTAGTSAALKVGSMTLDASRIVRLNEIASMASKTERAAALAADSARLGRPVSAIEKAYIVAKATKMPLIREVKAGAHADDANTVTYTIDRAKTPWGRALQNQTLKLRESAKIRDLPVVGANRLAIKQLRETLGQTTKEGAAAYARAQKSFDDLSREEKRALYIVSEASRLGGERATWLDQKIESLRTLLGEAKNDGERKDLQRQLDNLGAGAVGDAERSKRWLKIQDAIVNPSKKFEIAREEARAASRRMMADNGIDEATAFERIYGPARVVHGARWSRGGDYRFVPHADPHVEERAAAQAAEQEARRARQEAETAFRNTPRPDEFVPSGRMAEVKAEIERLERQKAGAPHDWSDVNEQHLKILKDLYESRTTGQRAAWHAAQDARSRAFQDAEQAAHDARQAHEAAQARVDAIPTAPGGRFVRGEAGLEGGPTAQELHNAGPDEVHGHAFYFPHRGPQMQTSSILTGAKGTMPLGQIKPDSGQRLWQAVRQTTGSYMTDPSAWTRAGMSALRWRFAHDFQKWLHDNVAVEIDPVTGHLPKGYTWFQPMAEKASRATKERAALHDALDDSGTTHNADIEQMVQRMMPPRSGIDWNRPVYAVPEKYAKAFTQEFARTNKVFRYLFERPMDFWRAAVLKLRPAWLVNNIVGQHLLYWITANPSSIIPYVRALRLERSGHYVDNWLGRMMKIPAFRNKYGAMLEDEGMVGVGVGTTHGTLGGARENEFLAGWRGKLRESNPNVYGTAGGLKKIITAWPRFTVKANQSVADDWPRYARFQQLARDSDAAKRVLAAQEALGRPMDTLSKLIGKGDFDRKIIQEMSPEERQAVLSQVDRALGNFNTLTPFERKYMRRIFPFYAWFKVIGAVSKDLLIDSPLRVNIVYNLEKMAKNEPGLIPEGEMPSWLAGAIATGPAHGGQQQIISTIGLNPFATVADLARAGKAPLSATGNPAESTGLLGPAIGAVDLFQGIDPFTGQAYIGSGDKESPLMRAIIGTLASLPETQLAQSYGLIPGYRQPQSYAPEKFGPGINQTLAGFLGLPIKQARLSKLHGYAKEGL